MKRRLIVIAQLALFAISPAWAQGSLFVYSQGEVKYSVSVSAVDSIVFKENIAPVADILDVQFLPDGSAVDVSPMENQVECPANGGLTTYWNNTYKRYVASFSNAWGGTVSGYYKVDYTNNTRIQQALADGHSLEILVMGNYSGTIANVEAKPFSSMQSGGTGFLISTTSSSRQNDRSLTSISMANLRTPSTLRVRSFSPQAVQHGFVLAAILPMPPQPNRDGTVILY